MKRGVLFNQYIQIGAVYPTYDDAGNMTKDDADYVYTYDYENRPLTITKSGQTKAEFAYDALGRRIKVVDSVAGTTTLYYYNTNWQVLCEKNNAGTTQRWYVYGNYIDEPLMMRTASGKYYYIHDNLYSTAALVNSAGTVVERYEYDAYGKPRIMNASYSVLSSSAYGNPYLFTSRNADRLDNGNLWLQYNRNRYFSYSMGRMLTCDPLGVVPNAQNLNTFTATGQYTDGMSLYEYAASNPLNFTDFNVLKKITTITILRAYSYYSTIGVFDMYTEGIDDDFVVGYTLELKAGHYDLKKGEGTKDYPIPTGKYDATPSDRYGPWSVYLDTSKTVPKFSYVYIHIGNYPWNTDGCIWVGSDVQLNAKFTKAAMGKHAKDWKLYRDLGFFTEIEPNKRGITDMVTGSGDILRKMKQHYEKADRKYGKNCHALKVDIE